jgi:hypothetical protein
MPVLAADSGVFRLEIKPGASLDLATFNLTIEDSLTNQGQLKQTRLSTPLNSKTEFLHLTNASGAQDKYFGLELTPTGGTLGSTTVQIRGEAECTTTDPSNTVNRCYEITPSNSQATRVRFYYLPSETDGQVVSSLSPWHWNSGSWNPAGTLAGRGSLPNPYHWVEASSVASFSPFALTDKISGPTVVTVSNVTARSGNGWLPALLVAAGLLLTLLVLMTMRRKKA